MTYLLLSLLCVVAFAQPEESEQKVFVLEFPVITAVTNAELYEGKVEEIKEHIDQRKLLINKLTAQLEQQKEEFSLQIGIAKNKLEKDESQEVIDNLTNQEINKDVEILQQKQETIIELINNFKDVHFKHVSLLQEIENTAIAEISLEIEEPYTIKTLDRLNNYIQELQHLEKSNKNLEKQNNKRMKNLKSLLDDLIVRYTILINDKKKPFELYELLRTIYLYQADYAILQLRKIKFQRHLDFVSDELAEKQMLLPQVFEKIVINKENITEIKSKVEATKALLAKLLSEHEKLNKEFDKNSLEAELELDNIETKIKNTKDEAIITRLQLQKQLNLHKIQYVYFIKNLLQQKEQTLQLQLVNDEFQADWVQNYQTKKSRPADFKKMVKKWQNKMLELQGLTVENSQLLESLGRATLENSRLLQQNILPNNASARIKKLKRQLDKQLEKNQKTTQRLSLELSNNNELIKVSVEKNERILGLLSQQLNKLDQIGQWFGDKFTAQFEKIKKVIYYPLASFGDSAFTLAILFKVLLYIILGFIFLRFFRKWLTIFLTKRTKLSEGASHSIATLIYYLGGFLVFLAALSAAGFNLGQMMIVFGALGVGIGFGLQNIANNFISGMILLVDRTLTVGDSISLSDGTNGKVIKLAMRYTVIRTNGGYDIIVPNSELIANRVTSMTFDDNYLRIEIPFGVSYDSDPQQVKEITLEVANSVKHTINRESQKSAVLFTGFGDSSLDFVLRVWVFIYDRYRPYAIRSDYYFKLFKAFKEAGIEIPFPQRDLNIKSPNQLPFMPENETTDASVKKEE
jgi:small-conductance mechanosensitive channel